MGVRLAALLTLHSIWAVSSNKQFSMWTWNERVVERYERSKWKSLDERWTGESICTPLTSTVHINHKLLGCRLGWGIKFKSKHCITNKTKLYTVWLSFYFRSWIGAYHSSHSSTHTNDVWDWEQRQLHLMQLHFHSQHKASLWNSTRSL